METAWEKKSLVQKIIDRQGQYESLRQPYDDRFADIVDFVQPGLTAWDKDTEGEFRGEKIYEGTPPWALRVMADGWLGNLVSETLRWLKYLFSDKMLRDNDDVNQWLQDLEDHMYYVYRQSELYPSLAPYARAALSVGSPVIFSYEDRESDMIKCEVPHSKENYHGPRDGYHRVYQLTVLEAVHKFLNNKIPDNPEESKLSLSILNNYKNGKHTERHTFIRAIYRSDDPILENSKPEYRSKPWMEFYIEKNATHDKKDEEPILVQGYWTKPHIRWDYEINTDEFYARTPAWHAIQDIRSGQQYAKQMLERGQQELHPPMWAQRKFRGHIHMRPKGFTYYDKPEEAENIPRPILDRSNYNIGADVHDRIKESVERWFHVDLFRILSRLTENKKAGWPTATHIIELNAEKAVVLAPRIGRFTKVLRDIDTRFIDIERRAGRLPEPPDIVLEYMAYKRMMGETKIRLDVEFIGPLAQMQQRGLAIGRIQSGLAILTDFMNIDPMVKNKVKLSVALEKALEQVGFYQDAIVPETEYQDMLDAIAQKAQSEEIASNLERAADAVPKISKAIEPGSPLGRTIEPEAT